MFSFPAETKRSSLPYRVVTKKQTNKKHANGQGGADMYGIQITQ